jgi:hypothetical protein
VNLPRALFRGVGAGDGLGAGSLILTLDAFFLTTLCCFFGGGGGGGGVAVALRLLARVLEVPTLGPVGESPTDSALMVRAEIRAARIGMSPSKPGIGTMKLSRA